MMFVDFLKEPQKPKKVKKRPLITYWNLDKIAEEEKYGDFYAVATNLEDKAKDVLKAAHKRHKIEESKL